MATKIDWATDVWDTLKGCSHVSKGCEQCFAERYAHRFSGPGLPYEGLTKNRRWTGKILLALEKLAQPLHWKKPRRIFVNSKSDTFHPHVEDDFIAAIFGVMAACPQHTFILLTKRPERARKWFKWAQSRAAELWLYRPGVEGHEHHPAPLFCTGRLFETSGGPYSNGISIPGGAHNAGWPLPNVWIGVSVENQETAAERIPELLQIPAAVRFVSLEPMLGPVDFESIPANLPAIKGPGYWDYFDALRGLGRDPQWGLDSAEMRRKSGTSGNFGDDRYPAIDWVILGSESGPNARPFDVDWARSVRDQCIAAQVPFFLKQMPLSRDYPLSKEIIKMPKLDGQPWAQFPEVNRG